MKITCNSQTEYAMVEYEMGEPEPVSVEEMTTRFNRALSSGHVVMVPTANGNE